MLPPTDHSSYSHYEHPYRSSAFSETKPPHQEHHDPCLNLPSDWSSTNWYPVPRGPKKKHTTLPPRQPQRRITSPIARPKLTTTVWEDEGTLCYQVDAKSVCVARRQDNDMINGTKLLNVVGMSRGKRDGILKNERGRVVVKVGAMHLKGVWITFSRAKDLATKFKIEDILYPLFVDDPSLFLTVPAMMSIPKNPSWEKNPYQSLPSIASQQDHLFLRSNQQSGSCSPVTGDILQSDSIRYSYANPYPVYSNESTSDDHHFSPYSSYSQQPRKLSYPSIREDFDERRHSIHFPSSPPPESTQMKFAFSSPINHSSSSWTEPNPNASSPLFIRNDLVMNAGRQDHKGKKRRNDSPLISNVKLIKLEHE